MSYLWTQFHTERLALKHSNITHAARTVIDGKASWCACDISPSLIRSWVLFSLSLGSAATRAPSPAAAVVRHPMVPAARAVRPT
jgi:hypothetical protein